MTPDDEIFQLLSRGYTEAYPDMYKTDVCKTSRSHGIFHGADFGTGSTGVLDKMYMDYHSYMVCCNIYITGYHSKKICHFKYMRLEMYEIYSHYIYTLLQFVLHYWLSQMSLQNFDAIKKNVLAHCFYSP